MSVHDTPVLIAGAGPGGLMAAIALARQGVECLLVERRRELSDLPRATVISTRSMELLRSWGLEEEVLAGGVDADWLMWESETLATASAGYAIQTGLPTRRQAAAISPTAPGCVPQDHLEPVLLEHARSLGALRVELGVEVVGVQSRQDGARVVLRDVATGEARVVHARYVIGADGAHSRVRAGLGIPMRGPGRLEQAVSALFRAPLWPLVGDARYGAYSITHPESGGLFLPAGPDDRWLYGLILGPGERVADFTEASLARRIRAGAGVDRLRPEFERIGAFSFAAQVAARFRHGSAFLIGDAAHRTTPRGGTGMNAAMQDGYDLGWKLAWVLRGWAEPELLDSYEAERRPVAEHNVPRSADTTGSVREVAKELHVDLGGRIPHVWVSTESGRVSTLDLLGPGMTLFTGPEPTAWDAAPSAGAAPVTVRRLDALAARALGIRGGGALLARPDGVPAALWPRGAQERLAA